MALEWNWWQGVIYMGWLRGLSPEAEETNATASRRFPNCNSNSGWLQNICCWACQFRKELRVHELEPPEPSPGLGVSARLLNYRIAVAHAAEGARASDCQTKYCRSWWWGSVHNPTSSRSSLTGSQDAPTGACPQRLASIIANVPSQKQPRRLTSSPTNSPFLML